MKQKIKNWLIHKLGGVTQTEKIISCTDWYKRGVISGKISAYYRVRDYADEYYGTDWMQGLYEYVDASISNLCEG